MSSPPPTLDVDDSTASPPNAQPIAPPPSPVASVEASRMTPTTFPSWDSFDAHFDVYQRETFQVYICKSSTSVAKRNERIAANYGPSTCSPFSLNSRRFLPKALKFYTKTFTCTHAGTARSRSRGLRPNQQFRSMQCPARMNVVVQKRIGGDTADVRGWQVVVTQHKPIHNHPLDAETFKSYPRNRRVQDPMVLEAVNALRKAGVKPREIRKYIAEKEPTKHVTRSDVNNLLTKLKTDDSFVTNYGAASEQVESTRKEGENGGGAASTPSIEQEQLVANEMDIQEVADGGASRTPPLISPGFTLRRSSGGTRAVSATQPCSRHGEHEMNSLQELYNFNEVTSDRFKLRVKRLEEQNLVLYSQNRKLHEQNQRYVVELNEARKKAREAEAKVATLQKSEATLADGVSALTQEVARLKAENNKLELLAERQKSPVGHDGFESQSTTIAVGPSTADPTGSSEPPTRQVSKRFASSTGVDGTLEFMRPPKRTASSSNMQASGSDEASG